MKAMGKWEMRHHNGKMEDFPFKRFSKWKIFHFQACNSLRGLAASKLWGSAAAKPASKHHAAWRDGPAHGPFPLLALVPGWASR